MSSSMSKDPGPAMVDRYTKSGRRLWYQLTVLQQPERARACGSGMKSANDRRPVDPPPVVELRVYEGPVREGAKDITFTYNASFFLFVTLEHSRVIAHGRVPGTHTDNQPPVLTGSPVSGMAYLDRPAEAGYFLFPDLSVRHEGTYRLVFQLYEQPKDKNDYDAEGRDNENEYEGDEGPFCHRADVRSHEFSVFSAKKFPGLAESTHLSRMVAEQGCRVRIRRDVRMRRRDGKPSGGDFEKPEDDFARTRRASQTPEVPRDPYFRARSGSATSDHRAPYPTPEHQRRPSGVDSYPPPPPPSYVGNQPAPHGNLRFGEEAKPQFPQHYHQSSQPPPVSPTAAYHGHGSQYPPPPPPPPSSAPYPSNGTSHQSYPPPPPPPSKVPDAHERRMSGPYPPPSPAHPPLPRVDLKSLTNPSYPPPPSPSTSGPYPPSAHHHDSSRRLPPLSDLVREVDHGMGPTPGESTVRPELSFPRPPRFEAPILAADPALEASQNSKKRKMDASFYLHTGPLVNHNRQADPHHSEVTGSHSSLVDVDGGMAVYKRANGFFEHKDFYV